MLMCCRERQKATISSLEAEVTQKLAELEALSAENEMLKLRSAVLEAVTSGREYHVSAICTLTGGILQGRDLGTVDLGTAVWWGAPRRNGQWTDAHVVGTLAPFQAATWFRHFGGDGDGVLTWQGMWWFRALSDGQPLKHV